MNVRIVSPLEWELRNPLDEARKERLLCSVAPAELLTAASDEAFQGATSGQVRLNWEPSLCSPGFFRIVAIVPLSEPTFDQLFNGRAGYRAQYYLSPEEGLIYNRMLIQSLTPSIRAAHRIRPVSVSFDLLERSLSTPHSKVWVHGDQQAFEHALPWTLCPLRWRNNGAERGCRVPLPRSPALDVKGSFIDPTSDAFFVDEMKVDRACDIHLKGFS